MAIINTRPDIAKRLLFLQTWRPSRRDIRICFRSMYFAETPFEQPSETYYETDPEYITLSAQSKAEFKRQLQQPDEPVNIQVRSNSIYLNNTHTINIPATRFAILRGLYIKHNMSDVHHMYLCIAFTYTAYKFCKNYMTLLLHKYPHVAQVGTTTQPYYSLYDIDMAFGSRGPFTWRADTAGATVYMPIMEIAAVLKNCVVIVPDRAGTHSVELSDGRRIFKIYLRKVEYIPDDKSGDQNGTQTRT